jgi:REP element-mobilizing transposase RayT
LVVAPMKSFACLRYQLDGYVVMNDHVHALVTPVGRYRLRDILHSWKSFTAREMQREHRRLGQVWQHEYFDRIVRDEKEFIQKLHYIVRNPWKRWPDIQHYPWLWPAES